MSGAAIGMGRATGRPLAGLDHLRQSIADILTTPIGSRVMRRDYGSALPELIDAPISPETVIDLYQATAEALARWEPRFRLARVQVAQAAPGHVVLHLEGEALGEAAAIDVALNGGFNGASNGGAS